MIAAILLLAIVIFGLLVMFGQADPSRYYKLLIFLIVGPILLAIGFNHVVWFWLGLPLWAQMISVLLVPFLASSLLRLFFPKVRWLEDMQGVIFQTLVYAVTFPFRLLWRAGQIVFQRERHPTRLNPYRPVVGGRPPVVREGRERR